MKMSWAGAAVVTAVVALGIYDLIAVLWFGTGSTISSFMIQAGFKSPLIVFVVGFVCGHFFPMYLQVECSKCKKIGVA